MSKNEGFLYQIWSKIYKISTEKVLYKLVDFQSNQIVLKKNLSSFIARLIHQGLMLAFYLSLTRKSCRFFYWNVSLMSYFRFLIRSRKSDQPALPSLLFFVFYKDLIECQGLVMLYILVELYLKSLHLFRFC